MPNNNFRKPSRASSRETNLFYWGYSFSTNHDDSEILNKVSIPVSEKKQTYMSRAPDPPNNGSFLLVGHKVNVNSCQLETR